MMISQESTTKDVKLFGYDFSGHTRGNPCSRDSLYGCSYYKGSAIFFTCFFLSTTSEKLFISYKPSTTVQALKFCPVRPRVLSSQFGQESCPASSAKSLVQLGNNFTQSGCECLKKCLQLSKLPPLPSHKLHTFPKFHKKKKQGNTFTQSGCGCLKKCLQLSKLLLLPSHKLHTFPKIYKKKSWGIT